MIDKSKVLVVGGTGYLGKRIVKASLAGGHLTYVLHRPEIGIDVEKVQTLLSFKAGGAHLVEASLDDHRRLVEAVKKVDVVVSAISGVHLRSHHILLQLKLVQAIKDAGNIKVTRKLLDQSINYYRGGSSWGGYNVAEGGRRKVYQSLVRLPRVAVTVTTDEGGSSREEGQEKVMKIRPQSRFLPSEFGMDPSRMAHALEPGNETFVQKMIVRKAIEDAGIPFTYVSANCFAGYLVGGLCQMGRITPSRESVLLLGDGNVPAIFVDEDDIAAYTIKMIDDPRTLNKTIYIRPPENILSQRQVVGLWEKLIKKELHKTSISAEDFLASKKDLDYAQQAGLGHFYHIFYEGCLTNFDIGDGGEEASKLYPEINYVRIEEYLKRYL